MQGKTGLKYREGGRTVGSGRVSNPDNEESGEVKWLKQVVFK